MKVCLQTLFLSYTGAEHISGSEGRLFFFGCVGSLLLHADSLVAASRLLIAVASLVAEHGL